MLEYFGEECRNGNPQNDPGKMQSEIRARRCEEAHERSFSDRFSFAVLTLENASISEIRRFISERL